MANAVIKMKHLIFIFFLFFNGIIFCQSTFFKYYNQDTGLLRYKLSFDRGLQLLELTDGYIVMGFNAEDQEFVHTGIPSVSDTTRPMYIKVDKQGNVLWNKRYENNTCTFTTNEFIKNSNNEYIGVGGSLTFGDTCGFSVNGYIVDNQLYMQKLNDNGDLVWQKTIGESVNRTIQSASSITKTSDGNYFIFGQDNYYPWLLKINEQGDTLWTKKYPSLYNEDPIKIVNINNGYLIFTINSSISIISRLDDQGILLWSKNLPFRIQAVNKTDNEHFLLLRLENPSSIITKIDKDANILWEKPYTLYASNSICDTKDGNFIIANKDFAKVSESGEVIWNKRFWGQNNINPPYNIYSVIPTSDGGYLTTGYYDGDTFLIKTDCNGNIIWDNSSCLLSTENNVLIFPNPFNDIIIIQVPSINKDNDIVIIKITNILGQTLYNNEYSNQNIFTLNTSQFAQGVYIYSVIINNSIYKSGKIIKQ